MCVHVCVRVCVCVCLAMQQQRVAGPFSLCERMREKGRLVPTYNSQQCGNNSAGNNSACDNSACNNSAYNNSAYNSASNSACDSQQCLQQQCLQQCLQPSTVPATVNSACNNSACDIQQCLQQCLQQSTVRQHRAAAPLPSCECMQIKGREVRRCVCLQSVVFVSNQRCCGVSS